MSRSLSSNAIANIVQALAGAALLFVLYRYINATLGVERLGVWSVVLATASASRLAQRSRRERPAREKLPQPRPGHGADHPGRGLMEEVTDIARKYAHHRDRSKIPWVLPSRQGGQAAQAPAPAHRMARQGT